jgi:hypothetical protein
LQDWYRDGIPVWWDESQRVDFDAEPRISKSRAAIERAQERASSAKNSKSIPGRYYVAKPVLIDGDEMPTREEWLEEQQELYANRPVVTKFGRAPEQTDG